MGEHNFANASMTLYGVVLLLSAIPYFILERFIIIAEGKKSVLAKAIGYEIKGVISVVLYIVGIVSSFYSEWISETAYLVVALLWLIPDKRIEKIFSKDQL